MKKAFEEGWGGVVAKTVSLDCSKVINVTPRYAKMRATESNEVLGWENIELISDRPLEVMLDEFARLKNEYPNRILIASIMEEYNKASWEELITRCEDVGVDAFELNFSCPHGMPERRMGAAMGQNCDLLQEVCGWVNDKATIPVWAKMTPNITDITAPARTSLHAGCDGIAAINTINSIMGVNLDSLRPEPCVEGYSTPGGYSSTAVKPIALAKVAAIAGMIEHEFPGSGKSLSGIGGVNTGKDAAEFILLGADTVQVCSGIMMHGYPMIKKLCGGLQGFMQQHEFNRISEFKGKSLPYMTTHMELVRMQKEAIERKRQKVGLANDKEWSGEEFVKQSESMVAN
jgi:dihydropyrimidine dehydrogenase (NADP+)